MRYAEIDPAAAAPQPIVGWYDTGVFSYPNLPPEEALVAVSDAVWDAHFDDPSGWVNGKKGVAPAPAPTPSPADLARAALAAGCAVVFTGKDGLDGTYACDADAQTRLGNIYNLINRAAPPAFPGGLAALPWADIAGGVHTFADVTTFLAFEQAVADYALTLELIVTTNVGDLPAQPVTIA